jgi:hypothetical protein
MKVNHLKIFFGKDQKSSVIYLLEKMKKDKSVISYATYKNIDAERKGMVEFSILFKDVYSAYIFGHTQGQSELKQNLIPDVQEIGNLIQELKTQS